MFGMATITLGSGPHSSCIVFRRINMMMMKCWLVTWLDDCRLMTLSAEIDYTLLLVSSIMLKIEIFCIGLVITWLSDIVLNKAT